MNKTKASLRATTSPAPLPKRLEELRDPEVEKSLLRLRAKYAKHAIPLRRLRQELDKALGDVKLTDVLNAVRGE